MTAKIEWTSAGDVTMPAIDTKLLAAWIARVAASHGCTIGRLNYIFCDDEKILEVNRQFLHHDYFTDIITFDYSRLPLIAGELYISLDTVATNADSVGQPYQRELHRVIIHGVLHLCGINDKGPGEREIMERNEDEALSMLESMKDEIN
ncbi:MAG: rRNA maturation RNase YbeY [Duncaniella sp.]|nr:rRNA maturation RNase YbeY [Duncaniella sp.]